MKKINPRLKCSVSALAIAVVLGFGTPQQAKAADLGAGVYLDSPEQAKRFDAAFPKTSVYVEGGYLFNSSSANLAFYPDDDKLGNLRPLKPGGSGWEAGVGLNHRVDPVWDFGARAGMLWLGDDTDTAEYLFDSSNVSTARQNLNVFTGDLELGYRPTGLAETDVRLFGGLRAIHASGRSRWMAEADDKVGTFDDQTWAIGPRVGVELTHPIDPSNGLSFVGSASTAALFGQRKTSYDYADGEGWFSSFTDTDTKSVTIWNSEAMAGIAMPIADHASLTIGYRGQHWQNLVPNRADIDKGGNYSEGGNTMTLVHGPFARLTVALP